MKNKKNIQIDNLKSVEGAYATNGLVMTNCYKNNKKEMEALQVLEAKVEVDENHK